MKKNNFIALIVIVVAAFTGYNVYSAKNRKALSSLALANVEALARDESPGSGENTCYNTYTPADWFHEDQVFVDCYNCTQKKGRDLNDKRSCTR